MANFCVTFLFFSYAAASIIYLILGAFAASGNAALLIDHYHLNETNGLNESEKRDVKSRTLAQYFLASGITVIISTLLFIFCILKKEKGYSRIDQDQNIEKINQIEEDEDNIVNNSETSGSMPIEMALGSNNSLNKSESYNIGEGMKESINA